ncbi:bifunctional helix-turn-helix transcriptional regulator/GNAT family N-acetyltransferase [Kordiimonas aestuarii]|uniref:bifunctional helix-turn-helix transcriptional regulator/GNAT family N-acetyltransferase n=1 Tax=Kordiimonas aestuarii TaxID=1005925 RepID=UPI0021D06EFD|nr:bifunctional helix-turn-helix transcriptional regulator/GNAT family N-acetyltransferase [Kordiimonas aestuarii]
MQQSSPRHQRAEAARAFNRFYTSQLELLNQHLHQSDFTLTETRILFELANRHHVVANDLVRDLRLDAGYLSRILAKFDKAGLIKRTRSESDARQSQLGLTPAGVAAFSPLDQAARTQMMDRLSSLNDSDQMKLIAAMGDIRTLLAGSNQPAGVPTIRNLEPGDIGWVTHRQAKLYHEEYGWDLTYEALVAEILADFGRHHDKERERAWIAEVDGRIVGSIFLMRATDELAKLRLLYVEPDTRGMGLGQKLVEDCISGARQRGYKRMTLWTQSTLSAARKIYERAGFKLSAEEKHHSFGHDLIGETWDMTL